MAEADTPTVEIAECENPIFGGTVVSFVEHVADALKSSAAIAAIERVLAAGLVAFISDEGGKRAVYPDGRRITVTAKWVAAAEGVMIQRAHQYFGQRRPGPRTIPYYAPRADPNHGNNIIELT